MTGGPSADLSDTGKVLALSDAESEDGEDVTGHITVKDMAAELPGSEHYELLQFNEKRRSELKKTFDFACANGKLEAKQVWLGVPQQPRREPTACSPLPAHLVTRGAVRPTRSCSRRTNVPSMVLALLRRICSPRARTARKTKRWRGPTLSNFSTIIFDHYGHG
jgi:hypothetical protein